MVRQIYKFSSECHSQTIPSSERRQPRPGIYLQIYIDNIHICIYILYHQICIYICTYIHVSLCVGLGVWSLVLTTNRGVFIILSRTSDRAFLQIKISGLKPLTIFAEKLYHRCKQCVSVQLLVEKHQLSKTFLVCNYYKNTLISEVYRQSRHSHKKRKDSPEGSLE